MEAIVDAWLEALRAAYTTAKAEKLNELRGNRVRWLDARGVHPWSVEVGRIMALQALVPELAHAEFDPWPFRREAQADAVEEFVADVAARGADVFDRKAYTTTKENV